MPRRSIGPRRLIGASVAALFILAVLPSRFSAWAGFAREPVRAVLTPASAPMRAVALWLRPAQRSPHSDDPAVAALEEERDRLFALWRRSEQRIDQLETLLQELQRGRALNPELDFVPIVAPVVGANADRAGAVLQLRAGRDRGVTTNAVAVINGVHLVGRVVRVGSRVSDVALITHRGSGWIRAAVDPGATGAVVGCQLRPVDGEDLLRGDLDADASGVEVGMLVRLVDDAWPRSAQMLVLGRVVRVEPKESQPLRQVVTVRPEADLRRVSQVVLYTVGDDDTRGGAR